MILGAGTEAASVEAIFKEVKDGCATAVSSTKQCGGGSKATAASVDSSNASIPFANSALVVHPLRWSKY